MSGSDTDERIPERVPNVITANLSPAFGANPTVSTVSEPFKVAVPLTFNRSYSEPTAVPASSILIVDNALCGRAPNTVRIPGDVPGFTSPSNADTVAPEMSNVPMPCNTAASACVNVEFRSSVPAKASTVPEFEKGMSSAEIPVPDLVSVPALLKVPAPACRPKVRAP